MPALAAVRRESGSQATYACIAHQGKLHKVASVPMMGKLIRLHDALVRDGRPQPLLAAGGRPEKAPPARCRGARLRAGCRRACSTGTATPPSRHRPTGSRWQPGQPARPRDG